MPAKRKALKKGGSAKSSSKVDWATVPREQFVYLEVRARARRDAPSRPRPSRPTATRACAARPQVCNSMWASMRFTQLLPTSAPLELVRQLIIERHRVVAVEDLRLFLGEAAKAEAEFRQEEYMLKLSDLHVPGGSKNDHVKATITYDYPHFKSMLQLPRDLPPPPECSSQCRAQLQDAREWHLGDGPKS